jgi:hypothetical protein
VKARQVVFVGLSALLLVAASGCDWLQTGYDSGQSGANPAEPQLTTASVATLASKFSISTAGRFYGGQPIVLGDSLYATSFEPSTHTARLEQFDTATGKPGWSTTLSTAAASVTDPETASGTVYAATQPSSSSAPASLFAVAQATGGTKWSVTLPSGYYIVKSMSLDRGRVFVDLLAPDTFFPFFGYTTVVAVDGTTGTTVWTWTGAIDQQAHLGTVISWHGGYVVLAYNCCGGVNPPTGPAGFPRTLFLNEADGSVHMASGSDSNESLRVCANDLCYGTVWDIVRYTEPEPAMAVDPTTGNVVWTGIGALSAAVSPRSAILGNTTGLTAVDARTGAAQWTSPTLNGVTRISSPVIAGGVVFFLSYDGTKVALRTYDASNGTSIGSLDIPTPAALGNLFAPVVANGKVYLNLTGTITAYAP